MFSFNDPNLVFVKGKSEKKASYYQVLKKHDKSVTLVDIANNTTFKFDEDGIKDFVKRGVLSTTTIEKISHVEKLQYKIEFPKRKPNVTKSKSKNKEVIKRKLSYITYIHGLNLKSLTDKHLTPELQKHALSINDPTPPTSRTFLRWLTAYVEGGWDEKALCKYENSGNRTKRLHPEVIEILQKIQEKINASPRRWKPKDINQNLADMIEEKNAVRVKNGEEKLKMPSHLTITRWLGD